MTYIITIAIILLIVLALALFKLSMVAAIPSFNTTIFELTHCKCPLQSNSTGQKETTFSITCQKNPAFAWVTISTAAIANGEDNLGDYESPIIGDFGLETIKLSVHHSGI